MDEGRSHAQTKDYACGVRSVWTAEPSAEQAARTIAAALAPVAVEQLLVFFSPRFPAEELTALLSKSIPGVQLAGCTTSGEITPDGFTEGSIMALAFPKDGFRFVSAVLPDVRHLTVERGAETVRQLRGRLDRLGGGTPANRVALSLIDGLSNAEEMIVSALTWALGDIPLVGGSAGDDLEFKGTILLHDGQIYRDAALLLLMETPYPVEIFRHDHFEPTAVKLVVTASDSESRRVWELNAEPASHEYALMAGVEPTGLGPMSFAAHPMVVRIGGDYYCRSIQKVNSDGSLSFFCAIDDGVVLTVARPREMVPTAAEEFERIGKAVGGIDLILAFECVLRRLDAESRQIQHQIADLYRRNNVVGFHSYGEQYRFMHLNQTFTGVAIGRGEGK